MSKDSERIEQEKKIRKDGKKYRQDGDFLIAEDESHLFYRGSKFNLINNYYKRSGGFSKDKPCNLHRAVWIDHFGPIPDKHHIHHINGNRRDNRPENLQCLPAHIHLLRAAKTNKWLKSKENKEHLDKIRKKGKEWHASEEGRDWHRQSITESWQKRKQTQVNCAECGTAFMAFFPSRAKFCHKNCAQRFRLRVGIENENRRCAICDKYFVINKYTHTKACSKECGVFLYKQSRIANRSKKKRSS